ncbi:MAG: trehalose-phosphatase [Cyanobacteria bacterium SZAS TMP-1]|nr:trehalose-phosphatase [Cyanobacteria bacterium SZAS TMP-1]
MRELSRTKISPKSVDELISLLASRQVFLFLDRDGTLVPITDNPKDALLPSATVGLLNELSVRISKRISIVSARGLATLAMDLNPADFILAGNYGLEISFPSGQTFLHPAAQEARAVLLDIRSDLEKIAAHDPRLLMDDHQYSFCLHYHRVPPAEQASVHLIIKELERKYRSLQFKTLPTSYEIGPSIEWSKAHALEKIIEHCSPATSDVLYLAFGDSPADEPMFKWVNDRGGMSFKVGEENSSHALGSFGSPSAVISFLQQILPLQQVSGDQDATKQTARDLQP